MSPRLPLAAALLTLLPAVPALAGETTVIFLPIAVEDGPGNPQVRNLTGGEIVGLDSLSGVSPEIVARLNAAGSSGNRAELAILLAEIEAEIARRGLAAN